MDRCLVVAFASCLAACFVDLGGGDSGGTTGGSTATSEEGPTGAATASGAATTMADPTTGAGDSTGLIKPLTCGNGKQESDEDCDDGNNNDGDGCSAECRLEDGSCGDEDLDSAEECDDGNNNDGDGCSASCLLEGGCGDGTKLASEACDDGNSDAEDGCDNSCELRFLYAFVTAGQYDGALGGVIGADQICQSEAANHLPGTYRAWLASTPDDAPGQRFVTVAGVPYRLPDRVTTIADDFMGLGEGLVHPINETADGMVVVTNADACAPLRNVWTGIQASGALMTSGLCVGWQSASANDQGFGGYLDSAITEWTAACLVPCDRAQRLYCFQQAP